MPKAYALLQFDVNDPDKFGRYRQGAAPTILANGGKILAGGSVADVREGSLPAKLVTVLEFPSREAAETWYTSPEYVSVKHLRHEAASAGSLVFLDGFEIPSGFGKVDHSS